MLSWHSFILYCGLYAIAVAVPGPGVVAIVARALGSGFRATIPAAIGTAVGDLVWMTMSAFGLAFIAQAMGESFLIVKYAGVAYLVFLAYRYWTAEVGDVAAIVPSSAHKSFMSQLSLTLGNPKAMTFFLAILPQVVPLKTLNAVGYAELALVTAVLIPTIMLSYAALAHHARAVLTSRKARKNINKSAAVVMVGAGAWVAVS
ncbi:MAG: LysE family translocator [Rhizomicrobium sp.]